MLKFRQITLAVVGLIFIWILYGLKGGENDEISTDLAEELKKSIKQESQENAEKYIKDDEMRKELYEELTSHIKADEELENTVKKYPSVIVTGAEHCGSDLLERIFRFHPSLKVPENPAIHFFDGDNHLPPEYLRRLPKASGTQQIVDITMNYFNLRSFTPLEMSSLIQGKVILLVCDPVFRLEREMTSMIFNGNMGKVTFEKFAKEFLTTHPDIPDLMNIPMNEMREMEADNPVLKLWVDGLYFFKLEPWLKFYRPQNLMILNGDDLIKNPGKTMENIEEFLDLPKLILERDLFFDFEESLCIKLPWMPEKQELTFGPPLNQGVMDEIVKNEPLFTGLKNFYKETNEKLFKAINVNYNWS